MGVAGFVAPNIVTKQSGKNVSFYSKGCRTLEFCGAELCSDELMILPCKLSGTVPCLFPISFPTLESGLVKKLELFSLTPRMVSSVSV